MSALDKAETKLFQKLNTPAKIQDFLETLRTNPETHGDTFHSPRIVLQKKQAHCIEAATLAAAIWQFHGHKPQLVTLKATHPDLDHVIAIFKARGCFGAISKSNHAVLRFRDPVYASVRELVMSYFHEYFHDSGKKTLRAYSDPLDLSKFNKQNWITSEKPVWFIDRALNKLRYHKILNTKQTKNLRKADDIEREAGKITIY